MNKEKILEILISLIKDLCPSIKVDYSKINMNSNLRKDFNFDSLSLLLIAIGIEKKFDIELNGLDFDEVVNVSNIVDYIYQKIN